MHGSRISRASMRGRRLAALCLLPFCAVLLAACERALPPLPNDAYVWQRRWTPALVQALNESADVLRSWRVLAAELRADGVWFEAAPDLAALAATGRPVVLVLRLDGRVGALREAEIAARATATLAVWRNAGIALAGLEIDYDCATARLPAYTALLTTLKTRLPPDLPLSITALPTWLDSPALAGLLAVPDETVLQVHAVSNPAQGLLFDAAHARAWLDAYAQRTGKPWRVALPAYGSRVAWDEQGQIVAVESERPALMPGGRSAELLAAPGTVAAFVGALDRARPARLAGIVWFRLPTQADTRAWSLRTWRAVLARQPLAPALAVAINPPDSGGARDVLLANRGNADMPLPFMVRLDARCAAADGINGYTLEYDREGRYLRRAQDGLLRAGAERAIGWIRCDSPTPSLHVQP
ncbi:DUF3142 domain-containing protein [Achromobacter pulmonis]|uniref:DUF3142 domain-containing protein n=1 Tax=Achromobacter pulmonis TaxID=1389932 RepID=UPI0020C6CC7E|nr:DUF3142 domain-containing protein [Achromobacter pulmonis]